MSFSGKLKRINESTVPAGARPTGLAAYLTGRFSYLDETQWRLEISEGKVMVNGSGGSCDTVVKEGDLVAWEGREIEEPGIDADYSFLYEDEWLIAVDKTGDLPVHPAGRYFNNTLSVMLEKALGSKMYPVHRLDRETSGVILFTKTRAVDPEYAYIERRAPGNLRRIHKSMMRRSAQARKFGDNFDPALTEVQNARNNGFRRIYNAGLQKWEISA